MSQASPGDASYPDPPWRLHCQLWCTVLRVPASAERPGGVHGVAMVRYEEPSPLTYAELLVAHPVTAPARGVSIDQIWVDSAASMVGGRELWAIPKGMASFTGSASGGRFRTQASWSVTIGGDAVASSWFSDVARSSPRLPFRGATWQPGIAERGETRAPINGSARTLPCRARWSFDPAGPLAWLRAGRQLGSFRMADVEMSFG